MSDVRLWNQSACVEMNVLRDGAVRVDVAGPKWERGLSFDVSLERLSRAVRALQSEARYRESEARAAEWREASA